jgi:hypothetical protein
MFVLIWAIMIQQLESWRITTLFCFLSGLLSPWNAAKGVRWTWMSLGYSDEFTIVILANGLKCGFGRNLYQMQFLDSIKVF